jgi:uncharacterized membrane protein
VGLDVLFLGLVAKDFFAAEVGDMIGDIRPVPAVLFYLSYIVGVLIFVSGPRSATPRSTLLHGALFGLFCYATFELTALSMLRHWTWPVAALDISWGAIVTVISATAALAAANRLAPRE